MLPTGAERLLICGFGFLLNSTTKIKNGISSRECRFFIGGYFLNILISTSGPLLRGARRINLLLQFD